MAAASCRVAPVFLRIYHQNHWWLKGLHPRFYAVFSPDFKDPIIDKTELNKFLENKSPEKLLSIKVKPATNSQTCSVFYHPDVERFISYILRKGKRDVARGIVNDAFTRVKHFQLRKYNNETDPEKKKSIIINPLDLFLLAIKNVTPMMWYVKIKRSGTWYKVPTGISEDKAKEKAMKWLLEVSKDRDKKILLKVQLANEIINAANYEGKTIAKKLEMHKMCEANRGYANYWWT